MTAKIKPPTKPPTGPSLKSKAPQERQAVANPLRQADSRWQRTVRYGWDKGGVSGGRNGGRK